MKAPSHPWVMIDNPSCSCCDLGVNHSQSTFKTGYGRWPLPLRVVVPHLPGLLQQCWDSHLASKEEFSARCGDTCDPAHGRLRQEASMNYTAKPCLKGGKKKATGGAT